MVRSIGQVRSLGIASLLCVSLIGFAGSPVVADDAIPPVAGRVDSFQRERPLEVDVQSNHEVLPRPEFGRDLEPIQPTRIERSDQAKEPEWPRGPIDRPDRPEEHHRSDVGVAFAASIRREPIEMPRPMEADSMEELRLERVEEKRDDRSAASEDYATIELNTEIVQSGETVEHDVELAERTLGGLHERGELTADEYAVLVEVYRQGDPGTTALVQDLEHLERLATMPVNLPLAGPLLPRAHDRS